MKIFLWLLLITIMGSYTACHWDYHLSNYLFDKYCNEEGRVGIFIYERVELGEEYFVPLPANKKERRDVSQRYVYHGDLMVDLSLLEEDYDVGEFREIIPLSDIGPIVSIETSIVRRGDKKLLGKAVSLGNYLGWWIDTSKFSRRVDSCPTGFDDQGRSNSGRIHHELIREVFYEN